MRSLSYSVSARNLTNRPARFLLIVSLISMLMTHPVSNLGKVKPPKFEVNATVPSREHNPRVMHSDVTRPNSEKPHTLAASYYSVQDGLQATLTLNNKGLKPP